MPWWGVVAYDNKAVLAAHSTAIEAVSGPTFMALSVLGFATLKDMFIHRIFLSGSSDRGAWPWRPCCAARPIA
jgi:hypothetical protein